MEESSPLETVKEYHPYELAQKADLQITPDSPVSPGAQFLMSVRDDIVEAWERGELDDRAVSEIVESAPDVYTHTRWQEYVDLAAYQEEIEVKVDPNDLEESLAGAALRQIAERLANTLREELAAHEL